MSHSRPSFSFDEHDPLAKMQAVQITRALLPECWDDAEKLVHNELTKNIAGQLYYRHGFDPRKSGRRVLEKLGARPCKMFEYALGSVRESMAWYRAGVRILGQETVDNRLDKLEQVRRLLLATIPRERDRTIRPRR